MTPHQKAFAGWLSDFRRICLDFGGVEFEPLRFKIPTNLGALNASVHASDYESQKKHGYVSIFLRFETFSTGKVYDTLHGRDFNGWSGKWNIGFSSEDLAGARKAALRQLSESLLNVTLKTNKANESLETI